MFELNSRFIEHQPRYAALGKEARRELQAVTGRWHHGLQLGGPALEDLARGLRGTEKQVRYAKAVEATFGQWTANSPSMRAALVDYAPFGMWTRAASRFVLLTLPGRHPIKTAIIAAAYEMTEPERDALGLSLFTDKRLPEFLQGGIPLPGGRVARTAAFTSFGPFADPASFVAGSVLPQASDALNALRGLDWKGDRLANADGTPVTVDKRVWLAFSTQAPAFIPPLAILEKVRDPERLNPLRGYDKDTIDWLRSLSQSQEITVPATGSGGSSNVAPWMQGGSSSGTAPWKQPASSGGKAPWR